MIKNKVNLLPILFCSLFAVLCPETQGMDPSNAENEQTTYQKMKLLLDEHLRVNNSLLHSSKDKDIVVVLGATGSGKSTLINYLMGVELKVKPNEDVELVDPNNPLAMRIGHKGSQTLLPQCTTIDNLVFYDLPGFKDTRGTVINILASSFIKHIIEGARSTRLVFVTGQDQITSGRGESLDFSIGVSKKLFPANINIIEKSSLLVITKSINDTPETLMEYLEDKVEDMEKLALWSNTNRILPMSKNNFGLRQSKAIINKINQITSSEIKKINIEAVYSSDVKSDLKDIISSEMNHFMKEVLERSPKDYTTVVSISKAKKYFSENFEEDIFQQINASSITILLKPLSESIFESERQKILRLIAQSRELELTKLDLEKERLEREEERERIEAQNRALQGKKHLVEEQRQQEIISEQTWANHSFGGTGIEFYLDVREINRIKVHTVRTTYKGTESIGIGGFEFYKDNEFQSKTPVIYYPNDYDLRGSGEFSLQKDEKLVSISGRNAAGLIESITFHTNFKSYGPYGNSDPKMSHPNLPVVITNYALGDNNSKIISFFGGQDYPYGLLRYLGIKYQKK